MWGDRTRVFIDLSVDLLEDADLKQLEADAADLGSEYFRRERHHVASAFYGLAGIAHEELEERRQNAGNPGWTQAASFTVPVEFDPTASAEHNKDDVGTVMAHAMAMAESQDVSDDLAQIWFGVVRRLARERDRLRTERVIL
jgi:hypothetical protein